MKRLIKALSLLLVFGLLTGCGHTEQAEISMQADLQSTDGAVDIPGPESAEEDADADSGDVVYGDQSEAQAAWFNMKKYFHAGDNQWENMPDFYGGSFIDGSRNPVLTILLTDLSAENQDLFRKACQTNDLLFQQADYSYQEILAAYDAASALLETDTLENETLLGYTLRLEEKENCVKLTVPVELEKAGNALASEHPCILLTVDYPILEPANHAELEMNDRVTLTSTYPDYGKDTDWIYCLIENGAEESVCYGEDCFDLEVLRGETWMHVPVRAGIGYNAVGMGVLSGTTGGYGVYLPVYNTDLPVGQYRIAFTYGLGGLKSMDHIAYAEFTVVEQPERITFVPLTEQTTNGDSALAQGCVVVDQNGIRNQEALDRFARHTLRGAAEELRVVYPENACVAHITYHPQLNDRLGYYEVEIAEHGVCSDCQRYSYLSVWNETGQIVLTRFADLNWAASEGLEIEADSFCVAPAAGSAAQEIAVFDTSRPEENITVQLLIMDAGNGDLWDVALFRFHDQEPAAYGLSNSLHIARGGSMGGLFEEYSEMENHPIYIREAGENLVAVTFLATDGTTGERLYRLTRTPSEYGEKIGMEPVPDAEG